ncbi:tail fiber domain-containing protein [Flavobacterium chuncheonense]|uniref:Tail fiber domain-containing protein n=1 Tax=Flavobacterium chuncheonense TaxID=2026653 RepID=A0ABW5YL07_9FLAO
MKDKIIISCIFILFFNICFCQIGIGTTTPNPSSILDIESTTKGILIPRLTEIEKNSIMTPANGLLIYQTDGTAGFWYFNGTIWSNFNGATIGWSILGNSGNTITDYLGTSDAQDFTFKTNNIEVMRIQNTSGNFGIGTNNPSHKLHITGNNPAFKMTNGTQNNGYILTSDANGVANWNDPTGVYFTGTSYDWNPSGASLGNPISHWGNVLIGRKGRSFCHLAIDNGSISGSTFGIGEDGLISDGNNEIIINQNVVPTINEAANAVLGQTTTTGISNFWDTLYSANGINTTSDKRLKKDITPLNYGLKEVLLLNPVSYYWKEEKLNSIIIPDNQKELKIGFIAQEVLHIIPEIVFNNSNDYFNETENASFTLKENRPLGIKYEELIPVLIKAKQEQDITINELINEVAGLKFQLQSLKQ